MCVSAYPRYIIHVSLVYGVRDKKTTIYDIIISFVQVFYILSNELIIILYNYIINMYISELVNNITNMPILFCYVILCKIMQVYPKSPKQFF